MEVEKAKMMSLDMAQQNIQRIKSLFPNAITEVIDDNGKTKLAIDFDVLKQELNGSLIEEKQERYQMTWPDKKASILLANKGVVATLRPLPARSVNFDNTKNVYIEGDNLDALKILRETYLGKIKMIYIDPPYNTGSDFVYNDDFSQTTGEYLDKTGQYDNQGNRLVQNNESNGRFHTDWLNMIYPRLKVAKDLLSDDGTIFISIDDNELDNLLKICAEIFGEINWKATFCWRKTHTQTNIGDFARVKEYIVCFTKNINAVNFNRIPLTNLEEYRYTDENGERFRRINLIDSTRGRYSYEILNPNGNLVSGRWMKPKEEVEEMIKRGDVYWAGETPYGKNYLSVMQEKGQIANDFLGIEYGTNQRSTMHLDKLFGGKRVFDFSKPIELIKHFINLATDDDSFVLDFFSGSATTAASVLEINSEQNTKRKFILVQLPEDLDENLKHSVSNTEKSVLKNAIDLCDQLKVEHSLAVIGEERIRRVGTKLSEESGILSGDLDVGFRVFKLDSSNMNEVYYNPKALTQDLLESTVDNVKPGRTPLDLLFQVMLECGALLSSKIEEKIVNGKKVFVVEDNYITACFDDCLDDKTVEEIAKLHPVYACFKGSSFESDSANINAEQIFKTYSPNTEKVKVI